MARISLARQQLSDSGLLAVYSAANADGHSVENKGRVVLHVKNGSEETIEVKLLSGYVRSGLKLADRVVPVAAGTAVFIGPLDPVVYNQTDGGAGQVYVDYSATEGVTVAALLMPA
ncbi:MAG TPA: hypothetical protein GX716_10890 [Firmicutes bacterium]|jgi:hypothetical protein|nr:hypothetical protein [Candidatus Fermentithermobacillaceae bacterium]